MSLNRPVQEPWSRARFRKSSRSDGSGDGNCVAVAAHGGVVAVGDTKTPEGDSYQHFRVSAADFGGLVSGIKSGEIA
ncbi:DUF397 domain-containing protein [Glycomyces sp. NPDC048151]|uniref:DUF397 domain-containing protein n=1 Tax=Glycomyces sp. NPDC048151 TaxID=3364002 RepID=UPI0037129841